MNKNEAMGSEAFSEEIASSNAELIKQYFETEFLTRSLMGTDVVNIKDKEYQAMTISGVIDNETGELSSFGGQVFKEIEEFRQTSFLIKVIVDQIYKHKEERLSHFLNSPSFIPEVVDVEIKLSPEPRVAEIIDRTLINLTIKMSSESKKE